MQNFKERLDKYGYWRCRDMSPRGKGLSLKCSGDRHTCTFILHKKTVSEVVKLPPRFTRKEHNRLDAYSSDYFIKTEINRLRKPPK